MSGIIDVAKAMQEVHTKKFAGLAEAAKAIQDANTDRFAGLAAASKVIQESNINRIAGMAGILNTFQETQRSLNPPQTKTDKDKINRLRSDKEQLEAALETAVSNLTTERKKSCQRDLELEAMQAQLERLESKQNKPDTPSGSPFWELD